MTFNIGIFLVAFAVMFVMKVPIAFSLLISSTLYLSLAGFDLAMVPQYLVGGMNSFVLLAIPLFILAAEILNRAQMTHRIFNFADAIIGRVPGGMAHTNILASVLFSGMSGSSAADVAGLGTMEILAMEERGYDRGFSAAVTAASSTIGPIIPPSIPMVVYGSIAGVSVGRLFLGGIIPGLLMAFAMMVVSFIIAKKRAYPTSPTPFSLRNLAKTFKEAFLGLLVPIILLGGIYTGWFTPTEAAAVAVGYSLLIGGLFYKALSWKDLKISLVNTFQNTAAIAVIIGAANLFSFVLTIEQIPVKMTMFMLNVHASPWMFLLIINILFLILGCFMEINSIMLIFVPIVLPIIKALGISPVHFGVVTVFNMMIGTLTPPFGMMMLLVAGIAKVSMDRVIKELLPFIAILILVLGLITYIPNIVMFLPNYMLK